MNEDILKGKWLEIKGIVKEKWGRLTDNDLGEIDGKVEKLLGLLRKQNGYIKDNGELEYQDTIELARIVSRIREIMTKMDAVKAIKFIARYGQPLLANNQERKKARAEKKNGYHTDPYFNSRLPRRTAHLASQ